MRDFLQLSLAVDGEERGLFLLLLVDSGEVMKLYLHHLADDGNVMGFFLDGHELILSVYVCDSTTLWKGDLSSLA